MIRAAVEATAPPRSPNRRRVIRLSLSGCRDIRITQCDFLDEQEITAARNSLALIARTEAEKRGQG